MKVVFADEDLKPVAEATTQLPDDPFGGRIGRGLVDPPFDLTQLLTLAERHPIHSAALEQKTADVIGTGWEWDAGEAEAPDEAVKDQLESWFQDLSGEELTMHELLLAMQLDVETYAQGAWEVARDPQGAVRRVFHVPGHTIRFHKDGIRMAQARDNKIVWFKRWGTDPEVHVDRGRGTAGPDIPEDRRANELLVVRRPSRRSSWYGVPGYVSSIGWITLALAVRDDNLLFFSNRREPRWAVILSNLEESDDLDEQLRQAFTVDLRHPHRNIIIPIEGPGKVDFQKMSDTAGAEGSFEKLEGRCDARILVAHRIPPERLGMNRVGPLGGNIALASSKIYREAVISTSQALLSARLRAFIEKEAPLATGVAEDQPWKWTPVELDLTEEEADIKSATELFNGDVITLNEARRRLKLDDLPDGDPRGDMLRTELRAYYQAAAAEEPDPQADLRERLAQVDQQIRDALGAALAEDHEHEDADSPVPL